MAYFDANLEMLKKVSEPLAKQMADHYTRLGEPTQLGDFFVEPAKSGKMTIRYAKDNDSFFLHSPYDPEREAEQYAERALKDAGQGNFNIFFGLGLGYGVAEIVKRLPEKDRVFIFEPHFDLFYLAFCHNDLTQIFARQQMVLTCDKHTSGAMSSYMNLYEMASFTGLRMFGSPAFERLPNATYFEEFADKVRYEMTAIGGNIQTLMVMGEMQQMNIILNFPHIYDNPPFKHLIDRFKGKPAIIVSAGPSLEKNMHLLPELKDRALIIAVDTSTKPLMAKGIHPHVVVTGDPQEENARHLMGVDLPDVYLVAEPQSPVRSVNNWTGPKFMCTFHDNMMQWVDRVMGDRGRVVVWGSVAVMAYDIAVKIGADPIVFIGQDLSFPEGRTYTSGTVFEVEDKQDMTTKRYDDTGTRMIDMIDIYGQPIKTNRQMYAYFNFMKNRFTSPEVKDRRIVNATEGGILKSDKVEILSLQETIDKYMQERFDVEALLKVAYDEGNDINFPNLFAELDTLLADIRTALDNAQRGINAVKQTLEAIGNDDGSTSARKEIVEHYNRMLVIRNAVARTPETGRIIEMANQAGIYSFAQGTKKIDMTDAEGITNEKLTKACYHFHTLYKSTYDAVERLIPLFENARNAAQQRYDQLKASGKLKPERTAAVVNS
jgi:hypothetical protein